MNRHRHSATGSWLVLILICALVPKPAIADNWSNEKPIRLFATDTFGPIGTTYSPSPFSVDGRSVLGEHAIWGGELIQAPAGANVSVRLDSVGRVVLKSATRARVVTKLTNVDGGTRHLLIASLISGDMAVTLDKDAGAYIESCGTAFTATVGADFVIHAREGSPTFDAASGRVHVEAQPPVLTFTGRSVQLVKGLPQPIAGSDAMDTRTTSKKRVFIQFRKSARTTSSLTKAFSPQLVMFRSQATQIETPAAFRRVHLEVDAAVGTIFPTDAVTDINGVVSAELTAGSNEGTGLIRAKVLRDPGDPINTDYPEYTRRVTVRKLPFWRTRNQLLLGAAAAAVVVVVSPRNNGSLKQQPPPQVQ